MRVLSYLNRAKQIILRGRYVLLAISLVVPLLGSTLFPAVTQATPTITEYSVPTANADPYFITAGSDHKLWYTGSNLPLRAYGNLTTSGSFTSYTSSPYAAAGITAGPDGNVWFTVDGNPNLNSNYVGSITTTSGTVTLYSAPNSAQPYDITTGPDGNLWFTEYGIGEIGRITTSGVITNYTIPGESPVGIAAGPDGALWYTDDATNSIGRITTSGSATEYPVPSSGAYLGEITQGPDGDMWFTERGTNKIGKITDPTE